jgi:tRNA wybutosine-synthesizing protein 2
MRQTPFERIIASLSNLLPENIVRNLPDKWEKTGTVVTIRLPQQLNRYQAIIGKVYADVLNCNTTLRDIDGIRGVYREPAAEVIYGSSQTETIHTENHVRFQFDPQKVMFSSGNMAERKRMATISNRQETVVDLFAGIGYFSIPMAVYSKPKKIFACEINPVAYRYLQANIFLNKVPDIVEPLLGDNRKIAPRECADRVILGYLEEPKVFLPVAFDVLKHHGGIIHYHDVVPSKDVPHRSLQDIERATKNYHRSIELLKVLTIKSYAPGRDHIVLDVKVSNE